MTTVMETVVTEVIHTNVSKYITEADQVRSSTDPG